ncbi:MAG: hypothetical protein AB7U73_17900 [Pirellulales bacterium]
MNGLRRCCAHLAVATLGVLFWSTPTSNAGDATSDWTTTELDVTVTHNQILDSFDRYADFWPEVCRHVEKQGDAIGDDPARETVVAIIRKAQFDLHKQFFETDELAKDAITYTSWGLRRAELFRRVNDIVKDRDQVIRLRDAWQTCTRESTNLSSNLPDKLSDQTARFVATLQLDPTAKDRLIKTSRDIAQCMLAMEATSTAKLLRRAERQTNNPQARDLLHDIVDAADWALLSDTGEGRFGAAQFKAAWAELAATRRAATVTALK